MEAFKNAGGTDREPMPPILTWWDLHSWCPGGSGPDTDGPYLQKKWVSDVSQDPSCPCLPGHLVHLLVYQVISYIDPPPFLTYLCMEPLSCPGGQGICKTELVSDDLPVRT